MTTLHEKIQGWKKDAEKKKRVPKSAHKLIKDLEELVAESGGKLQIDASISSNNPGEVIIRTNINAGNGQLMLTVDTHPRHIFNSLCKSGVDRKTVSFGGLDLDAKKAVKYVAQRAIADNKL